MPTNREDYVPPTPQEGADNDIRLIQDAAIAISSRYARLQTKIAKNPEVEIDEAVEEVRGDCVKALNDLKGLIRN